MKFSMKRPVSLVIAAFALVLSVGMAACGGTGEEIETETEEEVMETEEEIDAAEEEVEEGVEEEIEEPE